MDWLKQHYDRVILAVMGLAIIVCAALITIYALGFNDTFTTRNSSKKPSTEVPSPGTALVIERLQSIDSPKDWKTHEGSLFVSEPYISRDGGPPINPLQGGSDALFPPITNEWIKQYGLDFSAGNLRNEDPDNDKFSNLEEFLGKTDPTDPKSMSPFYTKLRLVEYIRVPFRLKLSGSPEAGTYAINTLDLKGPTQFLKIGEKIEGTVYKLVSFAPKTMDKDGLTVDVSELTIENQETGQKIVLVNDKPVNDPTVYADLINLWDGTRLKVKKLESFSFKPEATVKYKLIDISDNEAVIESPQGTKITVPKADK
jgi:hypothetical protein